MGRGDASRSEEERLVLRARAGDPAAASRLCADLSPRVEAYVRRRMSAHARRWTGVEDLVQGVLLELVRELPDLPEDAGPAELLRRAYRIAGCRVRDAARNHRGLKGESALGAGGAVANHSRSVGTVTAQDRRRWLEELVAHLPEKYAVVVRLCGLEGLSCVEAARRLGLEADTVRKRYEVARLALARRLEGRADA